VDDAPGWDAIDGALARLYGGTEPHHWGTVIGWSLGGQDPLDGISAYPRTDPVPHWHYVSYGMTELYGKESEDPEESGWGFEFTFRLARDAEDDDPPVWAANLLQNLARYVCNTGNWFEPGHHMTLNGPIAADRPDTAIRAVAFVEDPELGTVDTVHGRVRFLQVVGLTTEEYEAVQLWNTVALLEALRPSLPLWVTDVDRGSLLRDPAIAARVATGVEQEGSSTASLMVDGARWKQEHGTTVVTLGALQAPFVARLLLARLPFGRDLLVLAKGWTIRFWPSDELVVTAEAGMLQIGVPPAERARLVDAVRPQAGNTEVAEGLVVEIAPTALRDQYGNPTGEVVG
jgi:suppressor of fused